MTLVIAAFIGLFSLSAGVVAYRWLIAYAAHRARREAEREALLNAGRFPGGCPDPDVLTE